MINGMKRCNTCGRDFPLIFENHYIGKDPEGGIFTSMTSREPKLFDCIDCPHCGSQNVLQERKRKLYPEPIPKDEEDSEDEEEQDEEPGCCNCRCKVHPVTETMQERRRLQEYCRRRWCAECDLHNPACRCGNGMSFLSTSNGAFDMSDEEIRDAYKLVFSE